MSLFGNVGPKLNVAVNQEIKESYSPLLADPNEFSPAVKVLYNIYLSRFFDLFNNLLNKHPSNYEDYLEMGITPEYRSGILERVLEEVNSLKYDSRFGEEGIRENPFNLHYVNYQNEGIEVKLLNPTIWDTVPMIEISDSPFIVAECINMTSMSESINFNDTIFPIMAMHPACTKSNKFKPVFVNEISSVHDMAVEDNTWRRKRSVLEISKKSIIKVLIKLSEHIIRDENGNSVSLTTEGFEILRNTLVYFSIEATMITVLSLRRAGNAAHRLLVDIYDKFCSNYHNAVINQQYMFTLTHALFNTDAGKAMLSAMMDFHVVTTIDLINDHESDLKRIEDVIKLSGEISKNDGSGEMSVSDIFNRFAANLELFYNGTTSTYLDALCAEYDMELKAYKLIVNKLIFGVLDGITYLINTGTEHTSSQIARIFKPLQHMMMRLDEHVRHGINCELFNGIQAYLDTHQILHILKDIRVAMKCAPENPFPGIYSNIKKGTPVEMTYTDDMIRGRYANVIPGLSTMEDTMDELEVFHKGTSNAVMNEILVKAKDITTFEQAMDLKITADKYLDLSSRVKTENANIVNFRTMLANTRAYVNNEVLPKFM